MLTKEWCKWHYEKFMKPRNIQFTMVKSGHTLSIEWPDLIYRINHEIQFKINIFGINNNYELFD